MDWSSRANLYDMPCVTISSFGSKIDTYETTVRVLAANFYRTPIQCLERERVMTIFPWSPLSDEIREPGKTLTSTNHISENIANHDLKFLHEILEDFGFV